MKVRVVALSIALLIFGVAPRWATAAKLPSNSTFIDAMETAWREMKRRGPGLSRSAYCPDGWALYRQLDSGTATTAAVWKDASPSCLNTPSFDTYDSCAIVHKSPDSREGCWTMHPSDKSSMVAEFTLDRDFNAGLTISTRIWKTYSCTETLAYFSFSGLNTVIHNLFVPCKETPFTHRHHHPASQPHNHHKITYQITTGPRKRWLKKCIKPQHPQHLPPPSVDCSSFPWSSLFLDTKGGGTDPKRRIPLNTTPSLA